ncbi:MAG: hypothetical protein R2912_06490 [Eubacteriales bacterium]
MSGELAAAFISGVQSLGVGACMKHFALNNPEVSPLTTQTPSCDERAMFELYLSGLNACSGRFIFPGRSCAPTIA